MPRVARAAGEEPAHDVLAAEEFAVPVPDPALRHHPVSLPDDPSGIAEPHDVLAAEEFAMPAPSGAHRHRPERRRRWATGALVTAALLWFRRRRGVD